MPNFRGDFWRKCETDEKRPCRRNGLQGHFICVITLFFLRAFCGENPVFLQGNFCAAKRQPQSRRTTGDNASDRRGPRRAPGTRQGHQAQPHARAKITGAARDTRQGCSICGPAQRRPPCRGGVYAHGWKIMASIYTAPYIPQSLTSGAPHDHAPPQEGQPTACSSPSLRHSHRRHRQQTQAQTPPTPAHTHTQTPTATPRQPTARRPPQTREQRTQKHPNARAPARDSIRTPAPARTLGRVCPGRFCGAGFGAYGFGSAKVL